MSCNSLFLYDHMGVVLRNTRLVGGFLSTPEGDCAAATTFNDLITIFRSETLLHTSFYPASP